MPEKGENDKEEGLEQNRSIEKVTEGQATPLEEYEKEHDEAQEIEEPSFPSDEDPFLVHIIHFENLVARFEPLVRSYAGLGDDVQKAFAALKQEDYGTAVKELNQMPKDEEKHSLIPLLSAIAQLKTGNVQQASTDCDAAIALNPLDPNAWICKAAVDAAEHNHVNACDHLNKAVELAPNDLGALISRGACLIRVGHFEEAIRVLYRAQKIDHSNVWAWINKGIAYAYTSRLKDALNCFNEALLISPDNPDARSAKQEMLRRLAH